MGYENKIRRLQNWAANRHWRIDYIFYPEDQGLRITKIKNPMGYVCLVGLLLCLSSFAYLMFKQDEVRNLMLPVTLFIVGFVMAAVGTLTHEWIRKRNWLKLEVVCLDYEIQLGCTADHHYIWAMRTLCKFEINGEEILCTPEAHWPKRKGEAWSRRYLQESDEGAGICYLRVDPENPYETELLCRV
jgi:hypothetical protein